MVRNLWAVLFLGNYLKLLSSSLSPPLTTKNGVCYCQSRRLWSQIFPIYGNIWDGRETVKSPIIWDFADIWKPAFTGTWLYIIWMWDLMNDKSGRKKRVDTFLHKCLRRILKVRWPMGVSNDEIRRRAGIEKISSQCHFVKALPLSFVIVILLCICSLGIYTALDFKFSINWRWHESCF